MTGPCEAACLGGIVLAAGRSARLGTPKQLLVLGGEPIDEPVVQYGPFVMNTEREIHQAILDYRAGRLGEIRR